MSLYLEPHWPMYFRKLSTHGSSTLTDAALFPYSLLSLLFPSLLSFMVALMMSASVICWEAWLAEVTSQPLTLSTISKPFRTLTKSITLDVFASLLEKLTQSYSFKCGRNFLHNWIDVTDFTVNHSRDTPWIVSNTVIFLQNAIKLSPSLPRVLRKPAP